MGHRCCGKQKVKRGLWSPEEDEKLVSHITTHGHGSWSAVPKLAGLQRCGKSCRLRWINYLRPDLRRGSFTTEEEQIIIDVHRILGNRWAQIAKHLPGRTDNEVKNFWNSCIKKKLISQGLDPKTHNLIPAHKRAAVSSNKSGSNTEISKPKKNDKERAKEPPPFSIVDVYPQSNHRSRAASKTYNAPAAMTTEPTRKAPLPPNNVHPDNIGAVHDYENPYPPLWVATNNNSQGNPPEQEEPYPMSQGASHLPSVIHSYDMQFPSLSCSSSLLINSTMWSPWHENQYYSDWGGNECIDAEALPAHVEEPTQLENPMVALDESIKNFVPNHDPIDVSFGCPSFDLEFTTLMSNHLNSIADLGWNL